ncbi:Uncharacterised protein [Klebsiella pneumoniae]|nr:Uncharacterised protein [Klebsiella pneumoniae]
MKYTGLTDAPDKRMLILNHILISFIGLIASLASRNQVR